MATKNSSSSGTIQDPIIRHLCDWCTQKEIRVFGCDEMCFWMEFEVPSMNRKIPIKVTRYDVKRISYRFDYKFISTFNTSNASPNELEEYIDTLERLLAEDIADPLYRFNITDVDGKKLARGNCWQEVAATEVENENRMLLAIRHAIRVISEADGYFHDSQTKSG